MQRCPMIQQIDILSDTENSRGSNQISKKVTVHKTWKFNNPLSLFLIPFSILKIKPNIVHFNVHMAVFGTSRITNFIGLFLPIVSRLMGFKTIATLHNLVEKINLEKVGFKNSFFNRVSSFFILKLIAITSTVTFTLDSYVNLFKERYKSTNVIKIPHGTWRNHVHLNNNYGKYKKILYIGHSGPYKDIKLLLETFKIINENRKDVKLVIAGCSHPNYPGYLEEYSLNNRNKNVYFKGYIPENDLPYLLSNSNVTVLPYYTCTGTSGVAHLASSYGTPMVATNLPEFQELESEGCGVLLSAHDPLSIALKINEILDKPQLANNLRERNLHFAKNRTWNLIASRFCSLYKQIIYNKK